MTQDFSHGKIEQIRVARFPKDDLPVLDPDITNDQEQYQAGIEHVMLFLEHNNAEDWYWRYGKERLYDHLGVPDPKNKASWQDLHEFVSTYAWIEGKWRFILSKPCWMLHMDVVDRVVMLYLARKNYEETRFKGDAKSHMDFLTLLDRIVEDVQELLSHCEIKTGTDGDESYAYVHHDGGEYVHAWVPSLLHRVSEWKTVTLPENPVMVATCQDALNPVDEVVEDDE
jgi:hypothetical protein